MRGAVQVAVLALFVAGCATSVDVAFDPGEDLSRIRTWDWLPHGRNVSALPGEEQRLWLLTSRLVEQELEARGFVRVPCGADMLVGYDLHVRRYLLNIHETGAEGYLASHHASPSYRIQSTTKRYDVYDRGTLEVVATDGRRERRLWHGELRARRRGYLAGHLPGLVPQLLEEFPPGDPAAVPTASPGCR